MHNNYNNLIYRIKEIYGTRKCNVYYVDEGGGGDWKCNKQNKKL